jgi:hypothetical protein
MAKFMAVVVALIVGLFVVVVVASASSTKSSKGSTPSTTADTTDQTTKAPVMPAAEKPARAWISKDFHDVNAVQADVESAMADIVVIGRHATLADDAQVVEQAQSGHDDINGRRNALYVNTSDSGQLGNAEAAVADGANGMKNSMGALVAYIGKPTGVTLASFQTQYQNAQGEWNEGLTTIYRLAHKSGPSTITEAQIKKIAKSVSKIANGA